MKYLFHKDRKRRLKYLRCEISGRLIKSVYFDKTVKKEERSKLVNLTSQSLRVSAGVLIHNRCVVTNQARSVSRLFKVERRTFREMVRSGLICGLRAGLW